MSYDSASHAGVVNASWPYMAWDDTTNVTKHFDSEWKLTCYLQNPGNQFGDEIGVRISSVFVIFILSTAVTVFPVLATKQKKVKIPYYVYLFARYFGSGVITATAFIHLLDPAYSEIGPLTCVGMAPGARQYSWPPAIALASGLLVFFMDFAADRYVEKKYGISHEQNENPVAAGMGRSASVDEAFMRYSMSGPSAMAARRPTVPHSGVHTQNEIVPTSSPSDGAAAEENKEATASDQESDMEVEKERAAEMSFQQQIAAFLILEFGVIFHSVIIGLTLGSASNKEFNILYAVIIFHQSFEGLGVGARLSAIPFPKRLKWWPWILCLMYGFTTPISTAIGIGIGHVYNPTGFTANVVAGILDSFSAGILMYTGFVELLARDFIFNPNRPDDTRQLTFMSCSVILGAGIMALIGKWA